MLRRRCPGRAPLALSRVGEACSDVLTSELRKISRHLVFRHATGEVTKDVAYRDSRATNPRLAESNVWVDGNALQQIHGRSLRQLPSGAKWR